MIGKRNKNLLTAVIAIILIFGITVSALGASIYYGSTDTSTIREIQTRLKNWGYYTGNVDGIFGYKTETAVKKFQSKNGLVVDGKVGPRTLEALGLPTGNYTDSAATGGGGSKSSSNSSDVMLLARCIYGEARGEPYTGMVAIGGVILNRVKDARFPKSISGVIYQPGAFTAVSDGQINLTPSDQAIRAAKDAMAGWDPSCGAVYYYNPATATNQWIRSRPIVTTIGKHVFCK